MLFLIFVICSLYCLFDSFQKLNNRISSCSYASYTSLNEDERQFERLKMNSLRSTQFNILPTLLSTSLKNGHSAFKLSNSSTTLSYISICRSEHCSIAYICLMSSLNIICCSLTDCCSNAIPFYLAGGNILMENISFSSIKKLSQSPALVSIIPEERHRELFNTVSLAQSLFSSVIVSSFPFVCVGLATHMDVSNSIFSNITSTSSCNDQRTNEKCLNTQISGIEMMKCHNPFQGLIISPASVAFTCINSSFSSCASNYSIRDTFDSGDTSFNDSYFSVDGIGDGGALYCTGTASLNVARCVFDKCNSTADGGSIRMLSRGTFISERSSFQNGKAQKEAGGVSMWNVIFSKIYASNFSCNQADGKGHMVISNVTSGYHVLDSNIYENGSTTREYTGCIHIWVLFASLTISSVIFRYNYANTFAGCIMFAELAEDFSPSVQLSYCSFHNNTAQKYGGNDIHICNRQIWNLLNSDNFTECFSLSDKPRVLRCKDEKDYECLTYESFDSWIPDISTNYQIKANYLNGINCDDCGFSPNCQTLKYSLTRNTLSTNKTIIADTCEFYEDTIAVGTTSIAISGLSRNETVIRSSNGSGYVFTVESGSIAIADCNLKHFEGGEVVLYSFLLMNGNGNIVLNRCDVTCINEQNVIHTSIFDLNGGECVFEDVKITSIRLYDSCIIRNSLGNGVWKLELKESNISRVSRSKRNGSLISGVANTGGSIIFSNCFIEDCSCEDGCGGGLNVRVENEGYFEINSPYSGRTFLNCAAQNGQNLGKGYGGGLFLFLSDDSCAFALKSISFQQCVAEKGKNLFVDANILKNVVNNQTFNFSMDLNDQLAFSGLERSVSNEFTIPLVCFYREFAGSAFVNGSEGMDFSACGFADFPCETIERAVDLHFVGIKRVIVLSSAFSFDHEMEFNGKEYEIGKNDTPVAIHVNASSPKENNGLLSLFLSTSFKGISFILPSSLNGRTSFIISSLSLSESKTEFSVCSFLLSSTEDSSTSLPYSLLSSNGGSVTLTEVSVLDLSFLSCSAFAFHYGTIDISKMVLNGSSTTASTGLLYATEVNLFSFSNTLMTFPTSHRFELIHIDNKSSSLLENNTFMNIWRDNDDGSVMNIEIGNGNVTELKNCSFENCVCSGSLKKGGAIKSCVEEGGSIIIHNCSVSECRVPSEDGFGGGFYLSFVSSSIVYLMKDIIFDKNTANLGDDVYLVIPSPEISITSEKWEGTTKSIEHKEKLWLMDSTPDRSLSASLICFLLKPVDETIYIDNNGIDYERCGWEAVPCESVQYSIDSFVNQLQNIIIQNSTKLETNILMGTTFLQLLGKIEDTEIITNEHGKLNVCGTSTEIVSKIEKLMFTVNFSLSDEFSLIQVQTGKLIVAKCVFGKKSATSSSRWNRWVCNIEGGEVQMESSWIGWASFVSTCGILHIESTGVASLNDVHIISVEGSTDGIITVEEEANALLRCCQMERITLKQGSLISQRKKNLGKYNNENNRIDIEDCSLKEIFQKELLEDINPSILRNEFGAIGQSIFVNNTNFTSCESENSLKGGVLFVEYNEGMNVKISNSIFLLCKAPKGKGGTTYLNCSGEGDLSFEFINDAFHLNDAAVGRDIFVFCTNLDRQINETQFKFNLDQSVYNRSNAIYGRDSLMSADDEDRNLIDLVASYRSDTIFVGDESSGGTSLKMCGSVNSPCLTVNRGLDHLDKSFNSRIVIRENGLIDAECKLEDLQIRSVSKQQASLQFSSGIEKSREYIVCCDGIVEIENQLFSFNTSFLSDHQILFLLKSGETTFISCSFESKAEPSALTVTLPFSLASISLSHSVFDSCSVQCLNFQKPLLECGGLGSMDIRSFDCFNCSLGSSLINDKESSGLNVSRLNLNNVNCSFSLIKLNKATSNATFEWVNAKNIEINNGCIIFACDEHIEDNAETHLIKLSLSSFSNITNKNDGSSAISVSSSKICVFLQNNSFQNCTSSGIKGQSVSLCNCTDTILDSCLFDGYTLKEKANLYEALNGIDEICDWNGSLLSSDNCTLIIHDLEIENSSNGGLQVSGGNVMIEMGMFTNNNPSVENYPSVRRNIHCSDNAQLNVKSLKGGDGILPNTSLWMLNERCIFEGIVSERDSLFFIPVLESVEAKEEANRMKLTFKGLLLVPCNLSFSVVKRKGEEKEIENYDFDSNGYLSEREVEGSVAKDLISSCGNEIEVSVQILFGNSYSPSSTQSFILKNKSVSEPKEDERISEVGNKERSMWPIVVVVMAIVLLIVLIVSIIFIVRWRKQKRRTKELEEIVNDNIKKDPKAFEMVTMEMSPEEQWRKAEREAEKRNEEKMQKRRMCGKKMEHSESSQYLLAECGSTENILLQDSDKIPEWILEKVDEKGEDDISRERTPSPSISSTSTVSTTDTDTTFVRTESLCPTTSSMSNLVDAMACSSPHEKLIVDLRDSLFMLLHGRNEKKEMRIGTQEEREVTAAQVLFWVANGALHSFDDEEVLQSLDNLSPLIVLFSEHMVIAIAFHSDCSEDDSDSDSSSISSSTIVTSSSSYSTSKNGRNSPLPSSAFEDDEDNKKECLRWKAPELLNGDKKHATKKTVVFSIGMMLWECLTLQIPFGEYEPTIAGQKILNGERPNFESVEESIFEKLIKNCVSGSAKVRFALSELKKEFIQYFPHNAAMLTMSDAVDYNVSYVNRSNNQIKQEAGSDTSEF